MELLLNFFRGGESFAFVDTIVKVYHTENILYVCHGYATVGS